MVKLFLIYFLGIGIHVSNNKLYCQVIEGTGGLSDKKATKETIVFIIT